MPLQITLFDEKLTPQDQIAVRYTLNGSVTIVYPSALQPHIVLCNYNIWNRSQKCLN